MNLGNDQKTVWISNCLLKLWLDEVRTVKERFSWNSVTGNWSQKCWNYANELTKDYSAKNVICKDWLLLLFECFNRSCYLRTKVFLWEGVRPIPADYVRKMRNYKKYIIISFAISQDYVTWNWDSLIFRIDRQDRKYTVQWFR